LVVNGLVLNDSEARQLSGERDLLRAGRWVCEHGVAYCIIEKGEDGSILQGPDGVFVLPAFPTEQVKDPTGAGDAFAGGLMGYLAREGSVTAQALRRALAYGTVMASFAIEDFSLEGLKAATTEHIENRLRELVSRADAFRP
jgi:sugar/nucleoside kinase (ribokinase family)